MGKPTRETAFSNGFLAPKLHKDLMRDKDESKMWRNQDVSWRYCLGKSWIWMDDGCDCLVASWFTTEESRIQSNCLWIWGFIIVNPQSQAPINQTDRGYPYKYPAKNVEHPDTSRFFFFFFGGCFASHFKNGHGSFLQSFGGNGPAWLKL